MKIQVLTSEFQNVLKVMKPYIIKNTSIKVLNNIKITADKNGIELLLTNLDNAIKWTITGEVLMSGSVLIPEENIVNILKLNGDYITITFDNGIINFTSGRNYNVKPIYDASEYQEINNFCSTEKLSLILPIKELTDKLKAKNFLSYTERRPIFQRYYIEKSRISAVDGFKLYTCNLSSFTEDKIDLSLTALKLMNDSKAKGDVKIYTDKKINMYQFGNITFGERKIDGEYLNIDNIIPKSYEIKFKADKKELYSSLDFASGIINKDKKASVPAAFNITNSGVNIYCNKADENFNEDINVDFEKQSELKIGFNVKFMLDAINCINSKNVCYEMGNHLAPIVIKEENNDNNELYIVLPVRIKQVD